MSTRAIQFLLKQRIPHEVITYDHQEKGAVFAARATAFPLAQTIKTLVVVSEANTYILALTPGNRQLSLKKMAKALLLKKVSMAEEKSAEKVTGYLVGGISPFGTKKSLPVIMEEDLLAFPHVLINAGQRGIMLKMDPHTIAQVLSCTTAGISDSTSG